LQPYILISQGIALIAEGFRYLGISLAINNPDLDKIPLSGGLIIVCNHPTGAIEGLGLLSSVSRIRADVKLLMGDILCHTLGMQELSIEVDNLSGAITTKAYRQITTHLNNGGALIMFPAGEVSRHIDGVIQDKPWNEGFLRFAQATQSNILPVYVEGKNSFLFYLLGFIWKPLSMLRVVPELLLHKNHSFPVHIGNPISFHEIQQPLSKGMPPSTLIAAIRQNCIALKAE
jgi:putative hemolysin